MTDVPFTRLFSMPAFEGLRVIRLYAADSPSAPTEDLIAKIRRAESDFRSYDIEAALALHDRVPPSAAYEGVPFYRECIASILLSDLPEWAKLVTLGRGRFVKRLGQNDLRDVASLFRQARLLDEPPDLADVKWWDDLLAHVRGQKSAEGMERARQAEQLSLAYEEDLLRKAGIDKRPRWIAIEDNTVGYDVLSYTQGEYGLLNKLVEVKSTITSPLRFFLTRNEWEQAVKYGETYVFHIWNLQPEAPVLYVRTVAEIAPHVPHNLEKGKWETATIPVIQV